jgi:cytochrome c peroxidase
VTATKAALGKALFWDEQLSSTRTVSCGTCHIPATGGEDPRSLFERRASTHPGADGLFGTGDDIVGSIGLPLSDADGLYQFTDLFGILEQATGRQARSALNAGFAPSLFWDGRADETLRDPFTDEVVLEEGAALEHQALGPPLGDSEMAHFGRDWADVEERIAGATPLVLSPAIPAALADWIGDRSYSELFQEVFGTADVTAVRVAMAIATYERVLNTNQTPLDAFRAGNNNALTQQEQRGRRLFNQLNCNQCHGGPQLTDNRFHYIGVRPVEEDLGRFNVTGRDRDRGRMRTPGLRNIVHRAPYMRNGRFGTLAEVVNFYDRGGDFDAPNKDDNIVPLNLSPQQKSELVAFLGRPLTDLRAVIEAPPFDRPQLYTESDLMPVVFGPGIAGTGGIVPDVIAIEPPIAGNPNFTVGVFDSLPGAQATLIIDDEQTNTDTPPNAEDVLYAVAVTLDENGSGSAVINIPNEIGLPGTEWFGRWFIADPAAADQIAASPKFAMTIFGDIGTELVVPEEPCDVNGDGAVNIVDIQTCVAAVISQDTRENDPRDVDRSGHVNIIDVQQVVQEVLDQ